MAYLANPYYGQVPGAPQALNWWNGNQFNMSGILPPLPPAAPPAPPLAATPTAQDAAVQPAAVALTSAGGAQPGGGGPGGGPGGLGPGAYPGQPNPGMGGGVGAPGGDQTFSGYPGVYAQAPGELNSQFGQAGGLLGMAGGAIGGIPGVGTVAGALGGALDAARYNGINAQYGVPGTVNPWGSAASAALAGIGIPFTNWNLAELFDVPSARARHLGLLDDYGVPLDRESIGYGALAANAPHTPGAPFGNTGWSTSMDPTAAQFPAGFDQFTGAATLAGLSPETAGALSKEAAQIIGANPDIFGQGSGNAAADSKGDITLGGDVSQSSGVADGSGYKFRGGLIGAPPGRFAVGGRVARNMAVRRVPPPHEYSQPPAPPPDVISDRDFYASPFREGVPGNIVGMGNQGGGAMRYFVAPGTADPMETRPYSPPPGEPNLMREWYGPMYAKGGEIPSASANITPAQFGMLRGIDPPGPDDQIAAVQSGEGVLTKRAMGKGWGGLLGPINAGKLDPTKVKGLLAAKPRRPR